MNPFSATENKWVIHPHVHNRVADSESIKKGLKAMFKSVEATDLKKLAAKIRKL